MKPLDRSTSALSIFFPRNSYFLRFGIQRWQNVFKNMGAMKPLNRILLLSPSFSQGIPTSCNFLLSATYKFRNQCITSIITYFKTSNKQKVTRSVCNKLECKTLVKFGNDNTTIRRKSCDSIPML